MDTFNEGFEGQDEELALSTGHEGWCRDQGVRPAVNFPDRSFATDEAIRLEREAIR